MANYVKQEENDGKIGNLMEPGNQNGIKVTKKDEESDGREGSATGEPQRQKYRNSKPNTNMTNDSIDNRCTSPSRNFNNGTEKVTNTETNLVTKKDERNNGEEAEAETAAEAKAATRLRKKYAIFYKYGINKEGNIYRKTKNNSGTETVTNTETNLVTTNDEMNNGEVTEAEAEAAATRLRKNSAILYKYNENKRKINSKTKNNGGTETVTNTGTNSVTTKDEGNNGEVSEAGGEAEAEADANSEISNNSIDIGSSNSESNYVETKIWKRPDKIENKMIVNNVGYDGKNPCETRESQQQKYGNTMTKDNNQTPNNDSNGEA